jgi:hypothetical protein
MTPYKSASGKGSGVTAFEIGDDYIIVQFNRLECYVYDDRSAGLAIIKKMKSLAAAQRGLSTFISQSKPGYSKHYPCRGK